MKENIPCPEPEYPSDLKISKLKHICIGSIDESDAVINEDINICKIVSHILDKRKNDPNFEKELAPYVDMPSLIHSIDISYEPTEHCYKLYIIVEKEDE